MDDIYFQGYRNRTLVTWESTTVLHVYKYMLKLYSCTSQIRTIGKETSSVVIWLVECHVCNRLSNKGIVAILLLLCKMWVYMEIIKHENVWHVFQIEDFKGHFVVECGFFWEKIGIFSIFYNVWVSSCGEKHSFFILKT